MGMGSKYVQQELDTAFKAAYLQHTATMEKPVAKATKTNKVISFKGGRQSSALCHLEDITRHLDSVETLRPDMADRVQQVHVIIARMGLQIASEETGLSREELRSLPEG
jgi:hypothetical protein